MVLRGVLTSRPITAQRFLGGARQALAVDARRVSRGLKGSVTPLALRERGSVISPLCVVSMLQSLECVAHRFPDKTAGRGGNTPRVSKQAFHRQLMFKAWPFNLIMAYIGVDRSSRDGEGGGDELHQQR